MSFHSTSLAAVLESQQTALGAGLSEADHRARRERFGPNQLEQAAPEPWWKKLLAQFQSLVVWILIVAALISGGLGEWTEALAILAIVLLNGFLGYIQEAKAEQAIAALARLSAPTAKVLREGKLRVIPASELVPGDVVELEAGDNIPADIRLARTSGFRTQEAALTGESNSIDKDALLVLPDAASLGDRRNMAYLGTVAAAGRATAVVVATGMQTELGRIAGLLAREAPALTPLQRRLAELGKVLVVVCLVLVTIVFIANLLRGGEVHEVFLLSVSLAVAAIPEGLPAVVTIALALGLQRLVRRNALVRKLPSVETLGSVTVICSDKTGTLTRNEMTVRQLLVGKFHYRVTGAGYVPHGEFFRSLAGEKGEGTALAAPAEDADLRQALTAAARCNNAQVRPKGDDSQTWEVVGDPTEGALLVAALKAGIELAPAAERPVLEIPFDSQRKAMSVVTADREGRHTVYTKGAPEVVLDLCEYELLAGQEVPLTAERKAAWLAGNSRLANEALRVLALAYRRAGGSVSEADVEKHLVFAGLCGMIDPPRDEVRTAVARCQRAGIRPVMITGDHPNTALAIARELKMAGEHERALSGQDLDRLSAAELEQAVEATPVYARVSAEHKLRVVQAWQARGQIVAMTGDGVNDAPAVQKADIGIAMGITGTDVTKESSDMVLIDDNFASIVNAVEEGRCVFDDIQKFVHYLLACNAGEVVLMFFAALVGWPAPLLAIQILWINLVTDGLPALALGMEAPEPDLMERPPRPPREPVITLRRGLQVLGHGLLIAAASAIGFYVLYGGVAENEPLARTATFCIMSFSQLAFSFSCRSQRYTMPQLGLFTNLPLVGAIAISMLLQLSIIFLPGAAHVFETGARFGLYEWLLVAACSLGPVTLVECAKLALHWLAPWRQRTAAAR